MVFGSCAIVVDNNLKPMTAGSVKIEGVQRSLLTNFEITQTFTHSEQEEKEVKYVFPTDLKICIYDATFVVGDEIIKPQLKSKEEAKETYDQAVKEGHTAVYGSNIGNGLTEFKLGNVRPNVECKVILKIAFAAQLTKEKTFFIKFPLDVFSPSGSRGCLDVSANEFHFKLDCEKDKLANITSNVKNCNIDLDHMIFSIDGKIQNEKNERSIIITFTSKDPIESCCLTASNDKYDLCSLILSPNLPPSSETSSEFIFLVDCSGSMSGQSIRKAGECLEFFIKSLPVNSSFNIIRFGSRHESLFNESQPYTEKTAETAIKLAQTIQANLGGTNIYDPLQSIFSAPNKSGQRQVFILTDGEVRDPSAVIDLVSTHSNKNRCFTIGLGRGCDAGLVEGIANSSSGKSDFVQDGDSISEKVIPQLESSLHPSLSSLEIHLEGNESFEVSPFPIPSVNAHGCIPIFVRTKKGEFHPDNGILITGNYGQENIEFPISCIEELSRIEYDKYGCSSGRNLCDSILPLFAFSILQKYERQRNINSDEKAKCIELSISSGVLCKYTGYVGMTESPNVSYSHEFEPQNFCRAMKRCKAGPMKCCKAGPMKRCAAAPMNYRAARHDRTIGSIIQMGAKPECEPSQEYDDDDICEDLCFGAGLNARPPSKPSVHSDNLVVTIMRNQKINGSWDDLKLIRAITGVDIDHIDDITISDPKVNEQCVATIIAIATLRKKAMSEKNSWALLETKALSWLQQTLPNTDFEPIIARIMSLI